MRIVRLTPEARRDLSSIRSYTRRVWGAAQARSYLDGLGRHFAEIAAGEVRRRCLAAEEAEFEFTRYRSHFVFFVHDESSIQGVARPAHSQ